MNKPLKIGIIGLVVGLVVGLGVGDYKKAQYKKNHHDDDTVKEHAANGHVHAMFEVLENETAPFVELVMHEDVKSGWNAEIIVDNFVFSPENVSTDHVFGEGHAHIYVDDVKINRVYGEWYHIGELSLGSHVIEVRLSTNDHQEYAVDGKVVSSSESILVVPKDSMMKMEDGDSMNAMEDYEGMMEM